MADINGEARPDPITDRERIEAIRYLILRRPAWEDVPVLVVDLDWLCDLAEETLDNRAEMEDQP